MPPSYTVVKENGKPTYCTGKSCKRSYSIQEFYGFCETCWINLSSAERAALKGIEVPTVNVKVERDGRITWFGVFGLWKTAITVGVTYLILKDLGIKVL